jgi:hypothetical protein
MRKLVWTRSAQNEFWGCSECAWAFNPLGPPRGSSLDEMKLNYERQREKEFSSHVCAQHSAATPQELRAKPAKAEPKSPRRPDDRA